MLATLGVAGAAAPALAACSSSSGDKQGTVTDGEPIKIGFVMPQTGANRGIGEEINSGFQLYLRAKGSRLAGHPVQLAVVDEGETADSAKAAVDRLLQDKVTAVVGVSSGEALRAVKDAVEASQIPLITPAPSPATLLGTKYIWRTGFVTDEPGRALGKWIPGQIKGGSVYVMAGDGFGVRDDVRAFVDALKSAGGTLAADPVFTAPGARDFTQQFNMLRLPSVRALFCMYSGAAGVEFVKQLKQANLPGSLRVYAGGLLTEGGQLSAEGDAAAGIYTAMNYSPDLNTVQNRRFASDYQKSYATIPTSYGVASFDAASVLDQALVISGADTSALGVNTAIGRLGQIDSPRGPWQFNQNRSPLQRWFLRQVKHDGAVLANVLTADLTTLG